MKYLVGLGVAACVYLVLSWWLRERPDPACVIPPLSEKHYRFTGSDEKLQARTQQRREAAEGLRRRAAMIDSGVKVSDILRRRA